MNIDGSLQDTYAFLADAKYTSYYRRAVLVIGNRGLDGSTCSLKTAAERAGTAHTANKIDTYVLTLVSDIAHVGGPILAGAVEISARRRSIPRRTRSRRSRSSRKSCSPSGSSAGH